MCLYVYDPVITQILWPALTKFDRGVQTALSYKVPTHFHRNRSLGRKGGLREHPAQGEVVVRSLKITGTKWDTTWVSYSQQSFAQISASITKHKSVESAGRGEGRLTELFSLLSLRNSRAWPQLQKAAERPGLKGGEEIPPSGLCRPRPLELLHGQSWPGQTEQGAAAKSEGRDRGEDLSSPTHWATLHLHESPARIFSGITGTCRVEKYLADSSPFDLFTT